MFSKLLMWLLTLVKKCLGWLCNSNQPEPPDPFTFPFDEEEIFFNAPEDLSEYEIPFTLNFNRSLTTSSTITSSLGRLRLSPYGEEVLSEMVIKNLHAELGVGGRIEEGTVKNIEKFKIFEVSLVPLITKANLSDTDKGETTDGNDD